MTTALTILILAAAIAMILAVLVQKSKGGGLASGFSSANSVFGVKSASSGIEKITWGLAAFIIVCSIAVVSLTPRVSSNAQRSVVGAPVNTMDNTLPDVSSPLPELPTTPAGEEGK